MKNLKFLFLFTFVFISMFSLVAGADNYNLEVTGVSPTSLIPGEKTELSFEIENTGDEDLENIIFSWEEKTGSILPIGLSNTKTIQELDEGDEETLDFDVFTSASAEPGLYELTLTLTYKNENETTIKTSKVGIIVGGQTDFDVSVSDVSSSGVIFSVANIGKNPANSVTIVIPSQTNFRISGSSSSIIGNLDKGDYSVASFQITSQSGSSSNLNVEIQYTDTVGTRQTITKIVQVQSTQISFSTTGSSDSVTGFASRNTTNSGNNNWFLIAFIISSILTIVLIVVLIKRNKRKNETN
ncbi:MAG: hypothetical protein KKB31_05055 [Nanoarchaeota archaeon]|nr:hypothetical protein [Nanoarchaeota archaeon]